MRRAILLNSTSTYAHTGCYLTMMGLRRVLQKSRIKIIAELEAINMNFDVVLNLAKQDQDIQIIINGEGSIHDEQPYAKSLLKAISPFSHRTMLLNAQVKNMGPSSTDIIRKLALIQARTKSDLSWLTENNCTNTVYCPDMLFFSDIENLSIANDNSILFTDSHSNTASQKLFSAYSRCKNATWINFHYKTLQQQKPNSKTSILHLLSKLSPKHFGYRYQNSKNLLPLSEILDNFGRSQLVVTGRYHAACLAIYFGKPVIYGESNTTKVKDVCHDFNTGAKLTDAIASGLQPAPPKPSMKMSLPELEASLISAINETFT